jgi:hypothetical protein
MASTDVNFNGSVFRFDQPLVIAMNRQSAYLLGIRLRYQADGYAAGTVLARNTTDGLYQAYDDGGSSGINTAACVLFDKKAAEDFDGTASTSTTTAVGIFGGCAVYKDRLTGYDANALTDLKGRVIKGATGDDLVLF